MEDRYIVMLHGFINLDLNNDRCWDTGNPVDTQEHADYDDALADGWNVWVRDNKPGNGEPFTSIDALDRDFDNYDDADAYAEALAGVIGCEVDRY